MRGNVRADEIDNGTRMWIASDERREETHSGTGGGVETHKLNETYVEGKGTGNGGKGEHASKRGKFSGKGAARTMKGDDEEDERVQVAPNMGAGGSYLQVTLDQEEGKAAEED